MIYFIWEENTYRDCDPYVFPQSCWFHFFFFGHNFVFSSYTSLLSCSLLPLFLATVFLDFQISVTGFLLRFCFKFTQYGFVYILMCLVDLRLLSPPPVRPGPAGSRADYVFCVFAAISFLQNLVTKSYHTFILLNPCHAFFFALSRFPGCDPWWIQIILGYCCLPGIWFPPWTDNGSWISQNKYHATSIDFFSSPN